MKADVIFINRFYWPDESATAQILTDLAEYLVKHGHKVSVISGNRGYIRGKEKYIDFESKNGVDIHRVPGSSIGRYNLIYRLWDYLLFFFGVSQKVRHIFKSNTLLITLSDPPLIHAWICLKFPKNKCIHWSMDVFPEIITQTTQRAWLKATLRPLSYIRDWSIRNTDSVVCLHDEMKSIFDSRNSETVIIPNWSPFEETNRRAFRSLKADWNIKPEDLIIGYSGNLGHVHDGETVRQAIMANFGTSIGVKFLFIGGGKRMEPFKNLAATYPSRIQVLPFISREDTFNSLSSIDIHWFSLYQKFHALVYPSKFAGILSVGKPCIFIGESKSSIGQIIQNNQLGIVIHNGEPANFLAAVETLRSSPELRIQMGLNARKFYEEHFAQKKGLAKWKNLIQLHLSSDSRA